MVVMASTTDMLRTTLGETAYNALEILAASLGPMSGRMMAAALQVAPTTATAALGKLREAGFAMASREGRADRWHLNTDNIVIRSWLEETRGEPSVTHASGGMSPYPTGGGGVTFERKVAVQYLAHLLIGDGAVELGDGRVVVSVAFQQAPEHSVDDLVIRAARTDESEPSLLLAVGVRRSPDLVQSDEPTRKLIRAFVHEVINAPVGGPERRVALVVAGAQDHAQQLAWLADLASKQMDAPSFSRLVRTPGKFAAGVQGRLDQVEALVRLALVDLYVADPDPQVVQQRTWELLSRLIVLMPRLETPDEADWAAVTNALIPVARGADLYGASRLRDRLVALADEYPPKAATVDLGLLRRDAHQALDPATRRHRQGWQALAHLHTRATASVRDDIASGNGNRTIHLDRSGVAAELLAAAGSATVGVVAYGDSGVGKSALVIGAATGATSNDPDTTQALCINLRHLPPTTLALESFLGVSLATLLSELSAPQRLLVIDGADAISEGMLEPFRYLADAGLQADVKVIAVTANDTRQLVRDAIAERSGGSVTEYLIPPLTDPQVNDVVAMFDELAALAVNPRSRELLRRPVVVDLLVRGGLAGTPLSEADAMEQVWSGLVRRHGQSDRGTPDAREFALLRLAELALCGGDALDVVGRVDPTALHGLRNDGLLRTSPDDPFKIGPEFAHDEVRRYAVARLLLAAGNLTSKLIAGGVPRWSLGAARLACQALLAAPDTPTNPLSGRFARLQNVFDGLVEAGHGDRWGDVPGEALLTLGDPDPVLRDAWPGLRAEPGAGLQRLSRLVDQRLRDEKGLARTVAVEPLINLLLDDETPWRSGEHLQDLLRDWLRALAIADTPADYPLRLRLRDRLVAACTAADRRLQAEREAAAAARAARSPEEIEKERKFMQSHRALFTEIGYPRTRRRARPEVPREVTEDIMVELLALHGPDLGDQGETILRRVARDAPSWLGPAVEELGTGRALAAYRRGFLAELTEAYYLDDEEDGADWLEDGIRHHQARTFGLTPLAAWYRGPFMALFQSDFRNGVAALNRLLNHAALVRARSLTDLDHYGAPIDDSALDAYRTEFDIAATRRVYIGDGHVWIWYRGTGVGPYPCMSALQALERVCDQLIEIGIPLASIVATLLDGCENLAMVGLVVGLLVRHLEDSGRLLDPYLAEPMIWNLEFGRLVHESSGLAASSDGIFHAERRQWSLREAAMMLVLRADDTREDKLRTIGQQLVAKARRVVVEALGDLRDDAVVEQQLVTVRAWASGLDRSTYEAHQAEDGVYVQSRPPDDVVAAMQRDNDELQRAHEAMRLMVRYHIKPRQGTAEPVSAEDLAADLVVAEELVDNPPALATSGQWDAPVAVAAAALEANLIRAVELPNERLRFAVGAVLRVGAGEASRQFEPEESYFEQGADRSAARVLPLLLSPAAGALRATLDGQDGSDTYQRATAAAANVARSVANETRVHLARGLDRLWEVPCAASGSCHHKTALHLAIETMRDCAFNGWDPQRGRRRVVELGDPVADSLRRTADRDIYFHRLDAAIRALGPASIAQICVATPARDLLTTLLAAHRRSLLAYDKDMDHRGTHALIAARALLTVAAEGEDALIFEHIDAYADNATLLSNFLRALSAAAEESPDRAATALRIWPALIAHVISLHESGHMPFGGRHHDDYALAALIPNLAGEGTYLYQEVEHEPIVWWQPMAWQSTVERWLPLAQGNPRCVDHLISFLGSLAPEDQARVGLPWVASLVLADPSRVANRTFLLSSWLIEVRQAASEADLLSDWQRVVDALVVAGVSRLAPYSE
jgi:DNA-binding transcriptional ArsR family regulator